MAKDTPPPATHSGAPTSGSDHGSKISGVDKGNTTLDAVSPKAPQQPVSH